MRQLTLLTVCSMALVLSACDSTRTVLGLNRNVNDEFAVLTTPPLTLPPNFNDLPSPIAEDAVATKTNATNQKAKDAALSQFSHSVAFEAPKLSPGEAALLEQAKADQKQGDIRSTIEKENAHQEQQNKSFIKDAFNIKDSAEAKTLDPYEEKKRLEQAQSDLD